jgi:[ribosomal protein S5]-alanine N-acetyltransferase
MKNKKLIGDRYILKPFSSINVSKKYIEWLNDPVVNSYLEVRHEKQTKESVEKYIDGFYNGSEKYLWGIYTVDSNKHIGTVNITVNRYNSAEVGLMIGDKSYWGKSASDDSLELVLDFAFNTLRLHRVTGGTYSENLGMNFTFKRLGFRREGVLKESRFKQKGGYLDLYLWAVLDREWNSKHNIFPQEAGL